MRKVFYYTIAMLVAGLALSSCDKDTPGLTREQEREVIEKVSGTYHGKLYSFLQEDGKEDFLRDSVYTTVTVKADQTYEIGNFPLGHLADELRDYPSIQESLRGKGGASVSGNYYATGLPSYFRPQSAIFQIERDGKDVELSLGWTYTTSGELVPMTGNGKGLQLILIAGGVHVGEGISYQIPLGKLQYFFISE